METLEEQNPALPYGTWPSNITAALIASASIRLGQIRTEGADVYWLEGRPTERGRGVVVRMAEGGRKTDLTPAGFSVRTRVHEYAGADFFVHDGVVLFANDKDQRLYRQPAQGDPTPVTPEGPWRYADGVYDAVHKRIVCVVEEYAAEGDEPANWIGIIDPAAGTPPEPLVRGNDFYSNPIVSPDGSRLAWLTWNHPNMPWDATQLMTAPVSKDGTVGEAVCVAGGEGESIFQPQWMPDGRLAFVSDRTGWWNLYAWNGASVDPIVSGAFETGWPQWVFGMSTYAFVDSVHLVAAINESGIWHLQVNDLEQGTSRRLKVADSDIQMVHAVPGGVIYLGGSPREAAAVVGYRLEDERRYVIRRSSDIVLDADTISYPRHLTFPTTGGGTAHGFYYPPAHPTCHGPDGEKPPLIVKSHGGPTACASTALDLRIQFWTSRGFAVLDVNYRGSTGFGRAYRMQLEGAWGVTDVEDCIAGALHLAEPGEVDEERLIITGSSAGGFTTLAALTAHRAFKAGASYYGVSDLEALARETHKFEARYLDRLIGPYPEAAHTYRERSPIHRVEALTCPVIFLQGAEDRVVPPSQAEAMVDALKAKGLAVAYVLFEQEGHGFRQADSITRALEAELYFYAQVFGLTLPEDLEPIEIANLPESVPDDVGDQAPD